MQPKELIVPIKIETKELFTESGVDAVLSAVDKEIAKFKTPSIETKKGRDTIKSFKMKITKTRTFLEKQGKDFVAEKKAAIKIFDAGRKKLRDGLAEREAKVRKPLTEYEEAEKARIEAKRQQEIFNMDHEEALSMNDLFNREKAIAEKEAELVRAEEERRQKEEAERLEKERIERENRIAQEAKERAEREAQEAIEEAKRQAEIEKQQAIKAAEEKAKAEQAKKERLEAEEKAKAERKAANKKHQAKINNEVLEDLKSLGIEQKTGKALISGIVRGEIRHLRVEY